MSVASKLAMKHIEREVDIASALFYAKVLQEGLSMKESYHLASIHRKALMEGALIGINAIDLAQRNKL